MSGSTLPGETSRPRCGVIIPTFDGAHVLRTCLEALLAEPPARCEWTLVVVDDASRDGTLQLLEDYADRVTFVTHHVNRGFAYACNTGAAAVGDVDHLVFLNNDTVPIAGWLDALVDEAAAHPQAGAIGSRLLYPNGTIQHAGVAIGQDGWPRHLYPGFPGEHAAVTRPKRIVAATGACLLVRRTLFEELGGFDTAFLNGYEDIDLCLRMGELGHEVRYCPRSVLYHLESVTRWPTGMPESTEHNDRLYRERWLGRVTPDDVNHYIADGLMKIDYGQFPPLRVEVSPLLATVERDGDVEDGLERLLRVRSAQVMELQGAATRSAVQRSRAQEEQRLAVRPPEHAERLARVVRGGGSHRLGRAKPQHLVSVLLPVKNGASDLREQLPLVLEQAVDADVEFVAVDSGSEDDSLDVLAEFDATIVAIDPADFDHGLTRNLAAQHANGDVLVFMTHRTRPAGPHWLAPLIAALDDDPNVAGVCSRVSPHPDADVLTCRDGALDPSGSTVRSVKRITDWNTYRLGTAEERRLLLNFHTVSAAIRANVLERIPFRKMRAIGEDLLWAQEVLESGLALVHEPESHAYHSHAYSLRERFSRNVDDGIANHDIVGRELAEGDVEPLIRGMVAADWAYLRDELGLTGAELEYWQVEAVLRRVAQAAGQWLGTNYEAFAPEVMETFSRVAAMRRPSPGAMSLRRR